MKEWGKLFSVNEEKVHFARQGIGIQSISYSNMVTFSLSIA